MKKIWYAVLRDEDDNDWGYGSEQYEKAVEMALDMGETARIAVIDNGNDPICENIIMREDF